MNTTTITPDSIADLAEHSHAKRGAMASIRRALASGELALGDVFRAPPECVAHLSALEVATWGRRWGRRRAAKLNDYAIRCAVNLALPLGEQPDVTLDWLVRAVARDEGERRGWTHLVGGPSSSEYDAVCAERDAWRERAAALDGAIAEHQRAVQGPTDDDAVGGADVALWRSREAVRLRCGEHKEALDLRAVRLWNAGVSTREIARRVANAAERLRRLGAAGLLVERG